MHSDRVVLEYDAFWTCFLQTQERIVLCHWTALLNLEFVLGLFGTEPIGLLLGCLAFCRTGDHFFLLLQMPLIRQPQPLGSLLG